LQKNREESENIVSSESILKEDQNIIVCIITPKSEELDALKIVFSNDGVKLNGPYTEYDFVHYRAFIPSKFEQPAINIYVSRSDTNGIIESAKRISQMTNAFNPKFVFMTGVCAGKRHAKVAFGDLLIATESFLSGNTSSNRADDKFISWVEGKMELNQKWKQHPITDFTKPSKTFQKQFILRLIFESEKDSNWIKNYDINVDDLLPDSLSKLTQFVPDWNELLRELSNRGMILRENNGTKWKLSESEIEIMNTNMALNGYHFPNTQITKSRNPKVHFGKFGTWMKVDETDDGTINAFAEFENDIIGLDIESASVYSVCEKSKVKSLVIKGVIDFADSRKDDRDEQYGNQLSAGYALELIKLLYKYSS